MSENLTMDKLATNVVAWAKDKDLHALQHGQFHKVLEEIGETARAVLKQNEDQITDGIGDIAVTLIIHYWQQDKILDVHTAKATSIEKLAGVESEEVLRESSDALHALTNSWLEGSFEVLCDLEKFANIHGRTVQECLNVAWNEIKDRTGKTVNGSFKKD